MSAGVSFLVRCRDEREGIGPLLDRLARQIADAEIVVVDSGSVDGTLDAVRQRGIEPIEIPSSEFTYGRALNIAAASATRPVCVAISAHALPPDPLWAARMAEAVADERVACAFGERLAPDLEPLAGALRQDLEHARRHPFYGYSNSAGGFRRSLWEERPFDESLAASEDKEWAWHWLCRGKLVVLDPALAVHHSHRDEGPAATFRRARADFGSVGSFRPDADGFGLGKALAEWAAGPHAHRSRRRALADPRRAAKVAGKWWGLHRGPGRFPRV